MSSLPKATSRRDLIKRFKQLGWSGPHRGIGPHPEYMERDGKVATLPNTHTAKRQDIGEGLLKRVLARAGISHDDWIG